MIISERIFELLDEKGISQKEFSDKKGIAQSTISDWKRKHTNPSADKLLIISQILKVPVTELLCDMERTGRRFERPSYLIIGRDSAAGRLIRSFMELDPVEKNKVIGYIDAMNEVNSGSSLRTAN